MPSNESNTAAVAVALNPSDILDLPELSKRLRVRPSCVYEWLRKRGTPNCIPSHKLGRHLRFLWSEVSVWVLAQRDKKGSGGRKRSRVSKKMVRA